MKTYNCLVMLCIYIYVCIYVIIIYNQKKYGVLNISDIKHVKIKREKYNTNNLK